MHFIVVGINFRTADVNIREKFHFSGDSLPEAYSKLNSYDSIMGSVILSTCNRVEIYACTNIVEKGYEDIVDFISTFHNIPATEIEPFVYKKNCHQAVYHLLRVVSSLDSMVIGEYQIQGQVRDAYNLARELKATNNIVNKLFQNAIQTGKKVRTETKIGEGTLSVATLAVEIVTQYFKQNEAFNVLLVGAGKMSALTASNFDKFFNNAKIGVSNRTLENALLFAESIQGSVAEYDKRYEAIKDSDVIVVSTSSKDFVIKEQILKETLAQAEDKKRLFIDLSIPRNIDPAIGSIENCFIYSIDDINKIIVSNMDKRATEIEKAEKIIDEEAEEYFEWYLTQSIIPTMIEIKNGMSVIKARTLCTYDEFFKSIDAQQADTINEMLDTYADKLIKVIMKNIRKATTKEELISITRTLKETLTFEIEHN